MSAQALLPAAEPPPGLALPPSLLDLGSAGSWSAHRACTNECRQADPGSFLDLSSLDLSFTTCRMGYRGQGADKLEHPGMWNLCSPSDIS